MDKDFDVIDTDLLNKCFEQLSLNLEHNYEGYNGECTEECKACKNKSQIFDFTESHFIITESDFNINVKHEDDSESINFTENISKVSVNEDKVPLTFIKEEEIDDEVKSEPLTDSSSSDDENYETLIERGGKEVVTPKRSHKKKPYRPRPHISRSEFESTKLYHCNSGCIVEDNSRFFQVQTNLPSNSTTSCRVTELNFPPESIASHESRYVPNIGSPESGYDTSQSSAHSPSPPIVASASPMVYDDQDKEKKIMEIINSFLEVEKKVYQKSKLQPNSIVYDTNCIDIQNSKGGNEPLVESVNGNIAGNFENGCASETCSDKDFVGISNFLVQNTGENGCASSIYSDSSFVGISDFQGENTNENECASSTYSDSGFDSLENILIQNTDEDLLLNYYLDLHDSLFNQSADETTDFCLENTELVTNQNPMLCCRPTKQEETYKRKISPNIKDSSARKALRNSFNYETYKMEEGEMLRKIQSQRKTKQMLKIIDYDEREQFRSLDQTNLHSAVIESNVEKVYCIVEALKLFGPDFFAINNKDANKKTALDYAIEQNMPLLIAYLKENNAVQAVRC